MVAAGALGVISAGAAPSPHTSLISVNSNEVQGDSDSQYTVALTPNGRFVAFQTSASNLSPGDEQGRYNVFLRDRKKGKSDGNGTDDVFVRDLKRRKTSLVSLANNGDQGDAASGTQGGSGLETLGISADGRFVEFDSYAENLTGNDGNGWIDVFVRDRKRHRTKLISVNQAGVSGDDESAYYSAAMTPDARFVAFNSGADDLIPSDANGSDYDIFIRGPLR